MNNEHLYLNNPSTTSSKWKKTRGFKPKEEEDNKEKEKVISQKQKIVLKELTELFFERQTKRDQERTITIPQKIDLIEINFLAIFNIDLNKKFNTQYGLSPVSYTYFNKTITFEIIDYKLFEKFINHLYLIIDSPENESYKNKPYNILSLIHSFRFFDSQMRILTSETDNALISLVSSANLNFKVQKDVLFNYLKEQTISASYEESSPDIIVIESTTAEQITTIAKNFDIVKGISSSKSIKVRPGLYGETRRDHGFDITISDGTPLVGVIDTGISNFPPIDKALTSISYDLTGFGAFWDESGHGTMVSSLIILGEEFLITSKTSYEAKAKIVNIKAIHSDNGILDIPKIIANIKDASRTHNVKIFNLSLNIPTLKKYNEGISQIAYELDKLAFEEELIIFISVGNYNADDLKTLIFEQNHPSHNYPDFFYNLNNPSELHTCWFTNILEPADSLNNISVGALASNFYENENDITPYHQLPAYYTRKNYLDFEQDINNTKLQNNQKNKNLRKPDLIFEGGDLFNTSSGIEIICSPINNYFGRAAGTSLSTPLITSYAAEILKSYPNLKPQTIKSLLINAGHSYLGKNPAIFEENVYEKLIGFGRPLKDNLILSNDNTITFIIENSIALDEMKAIPIHLPPYLAKGENKLSFNITLCYSFLPIKDNHLNYLPLYISFGIFKPFEASFLANNDTKDYQIKQSISWADDFFGIENRLLSNTKKLSFNLQPYDLANLNNSISLGIRCSAKADIPENYKSFLNSTKHKFSIALTIKEIPEIKASGNLYNAIKNLNVVENIIDNDLDIELT